jgi:hypothetical protein
VRNVNADLDRLPVLTFRTDTVRNVNRTTAGRIVLTKCTGRPSPPLDARR